MEAQDKQKILFWADTHHYEGLEDQVEEEIDEVAKEIRENYWGKDSHLRKFLSKETRKKLKKEFQKGPPYSPILFQSASREIFKLLQDQPLEKFGADCVKALQYRKREWKKADGTLPQVLFQALSDMCHADSWKILFVTKHNITVCRDKGSKESPFYRLKMSTKIDVDPAVANSVVRDLNTITKWKKGASVTIVEHIGDSTDIIHEKYSPPMPGMKKRDAILAASSRKVNDEQVMIYFSILHDLIPPKNRVRLEFPLHGMVVTPVSSTSCELHYLIKISVDSLSAVSKKLLDFDFLYKRFSGNLKRLQQEIEARANKKGQEEKEEKKEEEEEKEEENEFKEVEEEEEKEEKEGEEKESKEVPKKEEKESKEEEKEETDDSS